MRTLLSRTDERIQILGPAGIKDSLRGYQAAGPRERGQIYAREIKPIFDRGEEFPVSGANALGTLVGNIIVQRSLDLLEETYPWLKNISTNFTAAAADFNQTITCRTLAPPAATDYDPATGYVSSDITGVDVPVTLNAHKAVQVALTANDMSGTPRKLIEEEAVAMQYSIGKTLADALGALLTTATFANETVCTLANFTRIIAISFATALNVLKTPRVRRSLVLNSLFHGKLFSDPTIISLALGESWSAASTGKVPRIAGAEVFEWTDLPALGETLNGFMCSPDALVLAARLPNDYTLASAGVPQTALVETVTNPHTGLSVMLVKFCDHHLGRSYGRVAWMFGAAAGRVASLHRTVTA